MSNVPNSPLNVECLFACALAAAGISCCPVVHAQSALTLYGIIDAGVEGVNNLRNGGVSLREVSGSLSGSRWGVKGAEGLGGGWTAIFTLENGFSVNDGTLSQSTRGLGASATTTSRIWGRQAFAGLSAEHQQVTFGRQNSLLYDQAAAFDPMGTSSRYSILAIDSATTGRVDSAVKYSGAFGPIKMAAMYSTRYDTGYGAEVPGAEITGRFFSGAVGYGAGPIATSFSYEQRNSNTVATNTATERRVTAAATYTSGSAKAFLGYRFLRAGNAFLPDAPIPSAPGSEAAFANLYWAGLQYRPQAAIELGIAAYYQDVRMSSADPWLAVARLDYYLSKRTDLYLTAALRETGGNPR